MKIRLLLLVVMAGLAWPGVTGCSNKNIDTAKVRDAFQSLSGEQKDILEQALLDIEQSNFIAAARPLKKVALTVEMNKNQRLILKDTLDKVQSRAAKQKK